MSEASDPGGANRPGSALAIEPLERPPDATVRVPGSKSLTNRALVAAALAVGESRIEGILLSDDTEAMFDCLARLGVDLTLDRAAEQVVVQGVAGRLPATTAQLDARLSGTTSRFVLPLLGLGSGSYLLDGRPPLRARPMGDLLDALHALGVPTIDRGQPGHLPVLVAPASPARGGVVEVRGDVSSQFLSGLLLSGPCYPDGLRLHVTTPLVSVPYVELTVATMASFGADVGRPDERTFLVAPTGYRGTTFTVEPDASAASYFFAAAAITGGRVTVAGLGRAAWQGDVAFVDVLERMGATVERGEDAISVTGSGSLHGIEADFSDISDTAQTLAAVAVFADSPTKVTGIGFIRRKETDRIAAVVTELRRCGIRAAEDDDGFTVWPGTPRPTRIETYDDHRMAMSFALLGLRVPGIEIADPGCVAKTFPDFFSTLGQLR